MLCDYVGLAEGEGGERTCFFGDGAWREMDEEYSLCFALFGGWKSVAVVVIWCVGNGRWFGCCDATRLFFQEPCGVYILSHDFTWTSEVGRTLRLTSSDQRLSNCGSFDQK
jgi:hypothetical protein